MKKPRIVKLTHPKTKRFSEFAFKLILKKNFMINLLLERIKGKKVMTLTLGMVSFEIAESPVI
jgi:hypothetical protein